ncbi:MAG: serine hydrolase, partial [Bacteroidetes bacterium]|nr:serine hydrolase [Bacteroidota bacterium]
EGKLNYDDPVQNYLPSFPYYNITIRNLLNHTSGLPEYFGIAARCTNLLDTLTNESMLALLAGTKPPLEFQPGEKFQYCNTNYTTLASVIEKSSKMKCEDFFQQKIMQPLHLKNTFIYHLGMNAFPSSRVFGFHYEKGKATKDDLIWLDGIIGDGNIYATVEDLYIWEQALFSNKLIKKATFAEALMPGKLNNGTSTKYGFAWFIDSSGYKISHTGGWAGFRNLVVDYIKTNQALIILDNSGNSFARNILMNIIENKPYALPQTTLIANVELIDGTGATAKKSALRILNDKVYDIGDLVPFPGETVIDGHGWALAPGFIDSHSHHASSLVNEPDGVAATNQGVTTIVTGQDGFSVPLDSLKQQIKNHPPGINVATYTGHAFLREQVMGKNLFRAADPTEINAMKKILAEEIQHGSLGLSTGLEYEEGFYSTTNEVIELAKTASANGGRYISHIRSEDINLERSIEEIILIGKEAKLPVQISHIKIAMRSKWGNASDILARLQEARGEGVDITADCYPYTMWSSTPRVLFPKKDFSNIESANFATSQLIDPSASIMTYFPARKNDEGKSVSEIARINNETEGQALIEIIKDAYPTSGNNDAEGAAIVGASMSEDDVVNFMKWNYTNICSDGSDGGHPRGFGTFTRVLGRYVREKKIMPLETAVYKMTGLSAEHLGITDRGVIKPGNYADLVLFDPATVIDNATINNAKALSTGIEMVWVNGKLVYEHGKATHEHPGKLISR